MKKRFEKMGIRHRNGENLTMPNQESVKKEIREIIVNFRNGLQYTDNIDRTVEQIFSLTTKPELDEKEVEKVIEKCLLSKIKVVDLHEHTYYGVPSNLIYLIRDAICSHFSKPSVPSVEELTNIISNYCSRPGFDEYTRCAEYIHNLITKE